MSELEGENKVKDTNISFDSSEIEDKDKSELFTKIEGEEARKAAAERAAKSKHEKDIKEKAKEVEDSKKLDEKLKKAEKESKNYDGKKKNKILNFFFGGWRKWVVLLVFLLIVVVAVVVFYQFNNSDSAIKKRDEAASSLAQDKYREAEAKRLAGSFDDAKKVFESAIANCSREEKIYLTVEYAKYIAKYQYKAIEAYALIEGVESDARTDMEKDIIAGSYSLIQTYTGIEHE